jgi:hypothetical protein
MTAEPLDLSLFDVENVEVMPKVRDMIVAPVSTSDVRTFVERYHYTSSAPNNTSLWRWGLWHGPVLHGVVSYNIPTRETCASVFGTEQVGNVWHMHRLALSDDSPRNSESRLIAGSIKAIERQYPHVWAVLTYAATDVGHIGYVYQATNAIYTGTGGDSSYYIDASGGRHSTYIRGAAMNATRAAERGWTRHSSGPKHRYVYILGSKTQRRQRRSMLKLPALPYPKASPIGA